MAKLTKCKTCGKDVAASAKICPSCGAKLKMGMFSKLVLGVGGIVVLLVIAGVVFKPSPEVKAQKTNQKLQQLVGVSTVDIDFQSASVDSQIKANKGKAILANVVVQSVEKLENRYKVTSLLSNAGLNVKGVFFYLYPLNQQDEQAVTHLKTLDAIQVKGVIAGTLLGNLELDPAILALNSASAVSQLEPKSEAQAANVPTPSTVPQPVAAGSVAGQQQAPAAQQGAAPSSKDGAEPAEISPAAMRAAERDLDPVAAAEESYKTADAELNKVWSQLMQKLNDSTKRSVRDEQRAWIKSRDGTCRNMRMDQVYDCLETQTSARIEALKKQYGK